MKYSKENTQFIAGVPNIGDGNPLAMEEAVRLLRREKYRINPYYLQLSQLPAKLFHVLMTLSTTGARLYTEKGEAVRQSMFADMLGAMMWTEFVV